MGIPKAARERVNKNKRASLRSHNVASSAADFLNAAGSYEAGRNAARSQGIGRLRFDGFRAAMSADTKADYDKANREANKVDVAPMPRLVLKTLRFDAASMNGRDYGMAKANRQADRARALIKATE